jgi:hypothetical protein
MDNSSNAANASRCSVEMKHSGPVSSVWLSPVVIEGPFYIQFRDDHVHVEIKLDILQTQGIQKDYWNALRATCQKHDCFRVLVEGEAPRLESTTIQIIEAGMRTAAIPNLWVAYCLKNHEKSDTSELYRAIAASQTVHVKFFTDRDHALSWLRSNSPK